MERVGKSGRKETGAGNRRGEERANARDALVTGMEQDGNLRKKSVLIGSSQRGQTAL